MPESIPELRPRGRLHSAANYQLSPFPFPLRQKPLSLSPFRSIQNQAIPEVLRLVNYQVLCSEVSQEFLLQRLGSREQSLRFFQLRSVL